MVMIGDLTLEQLPDYQAIIAGLGNPPAVELTAAEIEQSAPVGIIL
jgi:hypothetical protein